MKTITKIFSATAALLLGCAAANAQTFNSGYFLDNFAYSYRLNPSLMAEKSFLAVGVGNINANIQSDLGLSSFLFPTDNGLVTGLHPDISAEQFIGGLPEVSNIGLGVNVNLLARGKRRENKFSNFEVNLRSDIGLALPRGFFEFLKEGSNDAAYDLSSLGANASVMAEIAYGRAKYIKKNFILGYRLKLLQAYGADANFDKLSLSVNSNELKGDVNGTLNVAAGPVVLPTDAEGNLDIENISKLSFNTAGFKPNFGAAIDLGLTWEIGRNLKLSAGVTDLGFANYKYNYAGRAEANVDFDGLEISTEGDVAQNATEQVNAKLQEIKDSFKWKLASANRSVNQMLPYTIDLGARFRIPFMRRLSVGALYTYKNLTNVKGGYSDMRVGATLTPFNWLSVSGNVGKSSMGEVCGAAASITLLGINIWAGVDGYKGNVGMMTLPNGMSLPVLGTAVPVPVDAFRFNINAGITLQLFATRHSDFTRKKE